MRVARRPRCLGDEAPSGERARRHGLARSRGSFETSRGSIFLSGYVAYVATGEAEKGSGNEGENEWISSGLPAATAGRYGPSSSAHVQQNLPGRKKKRKVSKFFVILQTNFIFLHWTSNGIFFGRNPFSEFSIRIKINVVFYPWFLSITSFCRKLPDLWLDIFRKCVSYFRNF